ELELEQTMRDDPALAAEYRRLAALREAVRRHAPRERAPQDLADRIGALAGPVEAEVPAASGAILPFRRPTPGSARMLALAASIAACGFVAGAGFMALRQTGASEGVATGLVADFARAEIADARYDVASSDRHTVKPWLAGRTTVSPNVVDLASAGFPLAGGRVAVVDRIPAPTLVYRHNEHLVAVPELPSGAQGARPSEGTEAIDGYHVARWTDPNLSYIAVDMDEKTLADFVMAFRQAQKPASERPAP
ncbi:MAG TPA: anti-sigma factor, partial [Roseiarcus sp.]